MRKGTPLLYGPSIVSAAIYEVVWFNLLASIFGNPLYALVEVFTGIIGALFLHEVAVKGLKKYVESKYVSSYTHLAAAVFGAGVVFILKDATLPFISFSVAFLTVTAALIFHNILIFSANMEGFKILPKNRIFESAALGVLSAGFILIPILGIYTVLVAAAVDAAGALFYPSKELKGLKLKGKLVTKPFLLGLLLSLFVINTQVRISYFAEPTHVFSIILYSIFLGVILEEEFKRVKFRDIDRTIFYIIIFVGLAIAVYSRFSRETSDLLIFLSLALFSLPVWTISAFTLKKGTFSLFAGFLAGSLSSLIMVPFLGEQIYLSLLMLLLLGIVLREANLKKVSKQYFPEGAVVLLLIFFILISPSPTYVQDPQISLLGHSFARHIPMVLHPQEIEVSREPFYFTLKKHDALLLETLGLEKGFHSLAGSRLREDGLLVQIIPLNYTMEEEIRILLGNTMSVFPHTSMWLVDKNAILLSSKDPQFLDYIHIREKVLGSEEIKDDMERLFFATEFTDLTIVDSFILLYFSDSRELFEYTSETGKGENGVVSIFNFKRSKTNTTAAITTPPMINAVTRHGDKITIEFLKVHAAIGSDWKEDIIIRGRYILGENTTDYGI